MADGEDIPTLPFVPTSIKESRFRTVAPGDMQTEDDIQHLIHLMWLEPECVVYYYFATTGPVDRLLGSAIERGDILLVEMTRRFFERPNSTHDYIEIPDRGGEYHWEWQKAAVERGPEFWQATLRLSERKRTELDTWRKIQLEDAYRKQLAQSVHAYDVFLSYAEENRALAEEIHHEITKRRGNVFLAPKVLNPGDDFAEKIRVALRGSLELWLLVSPASAKSEWVTSEWGAAWVLEKRIVPILFRCDIESLPERLRRLHCIDLHNLSLFIEKEFPRAKARS